MALNLNRGKIGRTILAIAFICGGLGAINFFEPATLSLNSLQSKIRTKPVSGDIVVVGIDSGSIREIGRWPWPRDIQGTLLRQIDSYNPKAVYVDIGYQGKTDPTNDTALRRAITDMRAPTKIIALAVDDEDGGAKSIYSHKDAVGEAPSVSAYFPYLFGYVWSLPATVETERGKIKSLAASIAGLDNHDGETFRIDYTLDPKSIPTFNAKDIMSRSIPDQMLRGKTVVLGVTDITQNDVHSMPGWGERPGVLFHVLGAETLNRGFPVNLGWLVFFLAALAVAAVHLTSKGLRHSKLIAWGSLGAILSVSSWLTTQHVSNDPMPAIALITIVGIYVARQKAALLRTQRNSQTGFADMTGYLVREVVSNALFIGASIKKAETRRGYVLETENALIMKEAGRRLSAIIDERQLTHNDQQQFLWEMPPLDTDKLSAHLESLRRLFAEPITINGRKIDIDIHFGVDRDVNLDVKSRMESALSSSNEALAAGSTFKIATSNSFEEHLSRNFAQEFDTAIARNEINILFEPQVDLQTDNIVGTEIFIVWKHPAYGDISGAKFYAMAAASNSMEKVSLYLCDRAAQYSRSLVRSEANFCVSLKIVGDVITSEDFKQWMSASLKLTAFRPSTIIFNIVDIQQNKNRADVKAAIRNIKEHGFKIGIGNFGATSDEIELLNVFKPNAIFLQKAFSSELLGRKSYEIYVDMALRIANASGVLSIADTMDDRDVLNELRTRGCNRAQGKIISNPLSYEDFAAMLDRQKDKKTG